VSDGGRSGPLSIGDVAERTGLSEATLRMWEARHGFPDPERLASGHRRYTERDVELLGQVLDERGRGLSLKAAIERVVHAGEEPERSLFAAMRRRRPELDRHLLKKSTMLAMSHAIEDELCVRAERSVLFGTFQHERHYRQAESRWRELSRTADYAVALADFGERREPREGAVELPVERSDPMLREWGLVCTGPGYGACLAGVERPGQRRTADLERTFETLWSVDPEVVHQAAHVCCEIISGRAPDLARQIARHLDRAQGPAEDRFDVAAALTSRMVAYIGGPGASDAPG
jgi:MerR family transcriptional regulator, light-induced transcriptional regulator